MTKTKDTAFFENKLLEFIAEQDPLYAMMQWLIEQLMEIEVSKKANAPKGIHSSERKTYRCGTRLRRFDTRLGTMYLLIPKLVMADMYLASLPRKNGANRRLSRSSKKHG